MNLNTGQVIARGKATKIPVPEAVVNQVEQMAWKQGIRDNEFCNKTGVNVNSDWIAGVDCQPIADEDDPSFDDSDEEHIPEEEDDVDCDEMDSVLCDEHGHDHEDDLQEPRT